MATAAISAIFLGLNAFSAVSAIKNSNAQASVVLNNAKNEAVAYKKEGDLALSEKAKELRLRTARQTSSFLNSGLSLEGTPQTILDETFEVGRADILNIGDLYNTRINNTVSFAKANAKNIINSGRADAIGSIANSFSSFSSGAGFSTSSIFGSQGVLNRAAQFGTPSGQGPLKRF